MSLIIEKKQLGLSRSSGNESENSGSGKPLAFSVLNNPV